jgi:hypothetical protein
MSSEPVRSYLLGTLEESCAAEIEQRYFTDRAFFHFVQAVETGLIEDYLAGRLLPSVKSRFEERYLTVPDLRRRVEEVRGTRVRARTAVAPVRPIRLVLIAAILLICVGGAALLLARSRMRVESLPVSAGAPPVLATLSLSPGVLKGAGAETPRLSPAPGDGSVRLLLDLPGQTSPLLCSVQVSLAAAGGAWRKVWSSPQPTLSTPSPGGQHLAVILDTSLLSRGDYLVEVLGSDGQVLETYSFRVPRM